jgi:hypothetical protein
MKIKSLLVLIIISILSLTTASCSAEPNNIGTILKANGFDWLFGEWETTNDANMEIEAEFEMEADGYAISIEAKAGSNEHVGIVYYSPAQKTILYTGADNAGRVFKGSWEIKGDKLVINLEQIAPDGTITRFVRYLTKVDADTMKSVTYNVINGKISEEPIGTLVFKRDK